MDQHGLVLTGHYDPFLVLLSVVLAILSAYAALDLAGRVANAKGRSRFAWLAGGAIAMGDGIWSMHYVGMLAFRLPVAAKYDWPTVLVSLLAAIAASGIALFLLSRPAMGASAIIIGSVCMGAGIAAMHYIGMAAMRLPAMCSYSMPIVLLSIILAVAISFIALWRTFALRESLSSWSYRKAANAVILGAAIPVMHYVGMAAATFRKAPLAASSLKHAIGISDLGLVSIILVTLAALSLVYLTSTVDRRFSRQALELEGSEQRYRRIVESTFDAFIGMRQDGTITDWNLRGEAMFGWTRQEAIGKSVDGMIVCNQAEGERQGFTTLLAQGGKAPFADRIEAEARRRDGTTFPVEIALSGFQWSGKNMYAAFVHDVTRRKTAELEREEARAAAEAASHAKSEFLANMSHEIRTPLNGVIGMTDLALETELTAEQRECLETVKFSADALLGVINDILDFSKIEAGKIEIDETPFDLGECIESTLKTLALQADEKGLELLCEVAPEVPEMLVGDPVRLRQIVTNLVANAIKFTNVGEVALHVQAAEVTSSAATLHFVISDTGIGIAAGKLGAIFESFVQADTSTTRKYGGTGLGLTISKRLTELMGGRIWAESEINQGSHFHFTLQFRRTDAAAHLGGGGLASRALKGTTVLVIDDNRTNRRILEGLLANWGMKPTAAGSGREALAALAGANGAERRYDLILTDMHMPEMDGFGLVEAIQKRGGSPAATIMMLSSAGHRGDAARCRELGIASYLLKPVRQTELRQAIERVLAAKDSGPAPAMVTRDSLRKEHGAASSLNILLAEDNEVNRRLAVRLIERRGHRVFAVSNGKEALDALESADYGLVLMDVQMPEMDGIEATLAIRKREEITGHHQPIIAMTALVMSGDRERCLDAGMDGYLGKPIRAQELDDVLETYGSQRNGSPSPDGNAGVEPAPSEAIPGEAIHVEELLERIEGDRDFLSELREIFRGDYPRQIESISDAVARQDSQGVKRASHALKGALSNLAAGQARDMAAALEHMASEGDLTAALPALRRLQEELGRVMNSLDALCRETVR